VILPVKITINPVARVDTSRTKNPPDDNYNRIPRLLFYVVRVLACKCVIALEVTQCLRINGWGTGVLEKRGGD
jgi:hypothetical protein